MADHATDQIWNHRIHQRWAAEDLTFWRLAFFPKYNRKSILKDLHEVLGELDVYSYAIYETLGLFDLFIRAWLPSQTIGRAEEAIDDKLRGDSLQLCEVFTVSRILRHWVWGDDTPPLEPEQNVLSRTASQATKWKGERIAQANAGELSATDAKELHDLRVLRKMPKTHDDGIKFLIVITSSVLSMTYQARLELEDALFEILEEHKIDQVSLYEGIGFGQFILMGRIPTKSFYLLTVLSDAINKTGIREAVAARPYTFVCTSPKAEYFLDVLPVTQDGASEPFDLEQRLEGGEGQELEVKGSARLDWNRYLLGDGEKTMSDDILNDGVLKALVGLLNADGGHIVVGALETDRQFGKHKAGEHPRLAGYPSLAGYICVGINDEYEAEGGWDKFRLGLLDVIASRIDPPPSGEISLERMDYRGRDICVVTVNASRATWYYRYLGSNQPVTFFVREDGRTVRFSGSQADMYKRAKPRG